MIVDEIDIKEEVKDEDEFNFERSLLNNHNSFRKSSVKLNNKTPEMLRKPLTKDLIIPKNNSIKKSRGNALLDQSKAIKSMKLSLDEKDSSGEYQI